ncbi:MAG: FAD-dependent oxidoreductase [bacterium]|nr:FAD-dependent oxidoreductase [bacterium]
MMHNNDIEVEPQQRIPVERTVDVLVAGGGPAGIAAGIAAAREGAKTLVVERYGYLGGMITGAHVLWVFGMGDGVRPKAGGIALDIRKRMETFDAIQGPNRCGDYAVDPEVFKWQAAEMLEEAGAELLLHTLVCDPITDGAYVRGFFTESKSGRRAILAKVVIDCTADADVAFRAGCKCDSDTHDVTLGVTVDGIDCAKVAVFKKKSPEHFLKVVAEASRLNGGVMLDRHRYLQGVDVTDAEEVSKAETQMRRDYFRSLYYLRTHMPGWENARIKETLPQFGVRQSRRIRGEYTLTDDDLRSSRHFEDSIARLGSYLLGYKLYDPPRLNYDIPFRCLVPKNVDGLLVAGRCISSDYLADNSLRLIVPCFATGQAAGVAASLAARQSIQPRHIAVAAVRKSLIQQGVYLDGSDPETPVVPEGTEDTPLQIWDDDL